MNFLSLGFILFFPVVYLIYWNIQDKRKRFFLLFVSSLFYSFFSLNFLIHIWVVILVNFLIIKYFLGKKYFIKSIVIINVLNLAFFKYFYFIMELLGQVADIDFLQNKTELNKYFSSLAHLPNFEIVLPLTISYYTFQLISLAFDLQKSIEKRIPTFYDIASYVLFFPIMIAGPILRFGQIIHQFQSPVMTEKDMNTGLWLIVRGIFKKAILSDAVAAVIYPVFGSPNQYSGISLLITSYFFAIHLYLDFSGLTDLARGIAKLLGFDLPENFRAPFFMKNFGDFWRRWHLTFSYWIRDYIYIPLGGSRKGYVRNAFNLIITFAIGGIWHGASMNFLLWGALTGCYLALERVWEGYFPTEGLSGWKRVLHYLLVLHIYIISWILFFTPDVQSALSIMNRIFTMKEGLLVATETGIYAMLATWLFHLGEENPEKFQWFDKYRYKSLPWVAIVILILLIQTGNRNIDFFYSQF